ncbi:PRTRC system ThiF family protein [Flavihumibacter petaseus]|uniref:THIF-type NAD/FAD binding fold domain-containing protein n=1 Tax=Flavihumibacter petaseus NBRC 106054 TaxID=1220578 RepID=A0A0E9N328_9BACT|nr:PRTRC system ThiF family protein [Flavihumibacter petaseus]GAO43765.1 hypothetical protein FPE01S_02_08710 [Flavihumibacter petaseus NBRC 106054]
MTVHYTHPYLLNPQHKVTINLVGLGGTGSQMLTALARINETLLAIGHPGIHVRSFDSDTVSASNIGRQLFSPADLGMNKAVVLTTRINRFFGYEWEGHPENFSGQYRANITISCIDSALGRVMLAETITGKQGPCEPLDRPHYWLDIGNLQKTGQVVLGTVTSIKQPKSDQPTVNQLPNVIQRFPDIKKIKEADQGPSCSVAQAISRQDLFINSTLAQFGANLIWKLFREGMLTYHGCYINLESFLVTPMRIDSFNYSIKKSKSKK